jgi:hypothetical protein
VLITHSSAAEFLSLGIDESISRELARWHALDDLSRGFARGSQLELYEFFAVIPTKHRTVTNATGSTRVQTPGTSNCFTPRPTARSRARIESPISQSNDRSRPQ